MAYAQIIVKLYRREQDLSLIHIYKQRQDEWEEAENERVKKEIRHLEEASRRTSGWSDRKEKEKSGAADRGYVRCV